MRTGRGRHIRDHVRTVFVGFAGGAIAYLLTFVVIFLRKAQTVDRDSVELFSDLAGLGVDLPSAWQVIGWLHYAAHNVDVVLNVSGLGSSGTQTLQRGEWVLWEGWFVLVPVLTATLVGFVVATLGSGTDAKGGLRDGSSIVLGYGPLAAVGVIASTWHFSVTYAGISVSGSIGPEPLTAVVLVGVVYPVVLGGIGGVLAGVLENRRNDASG